MDTQNVRLQHDSSNKDSLSGHRFCPFCGAQVADGYQFCGACGRQIPILEKAVAPASQPSISSYRQPAGSSDPQILQQETISTAAVVTQSKTKPVTKGSSRAAIGLTRIFGVMLGVAAIFVALFAGTNTTLDPTTFAEYVLGLGIAAIVFSGISRSLRSRNVSSGSLGASQGGGRIAAKKTRR